MLFSWKFDSQSCMSAWLQLEVGWLFLFFSIDCLIPASIVSALALLESFVELWVLDDERAMTKEITQSGVGCLYAEADWQGHREEKNRKKRPEKKRPGGQGDKGWKRQGDKGTREQGTFSKETKRIKGHALKKIKDIQINGMHVTCQDPVRQKEKSKDKPTGNDELNLWLHCQSMEISNYNDGNHLTIPYFTLGKQFIISWYWRSRPDGSKNYTERMPRIPQSWSVQCNYSRHSSLTVDRAIARQLVFLASRRDRFGEMLSRIMTRMPKNFAKQVGNPN